MHRRDTPRQSRTPTLRRRLGTALLGAISGGTAGWLTALLAGVEGVMAWRAVSALIVLGAAFGYRYGRKVVGATVSAFLEADDQ